MDEVARSCPIARRWKKGVPINDSRSGRERDPCGPGAGLELHAIQRLLVDECIGGGEFIIMTWLDRSRKVETEGRR